jgi:hypothetical protein
MTVLLESDESFGGHRGGGFAWETNEDGQLR